MRSVATLVLLLACPAGLSAQWKSGFLGGASTSHLDGLESLGSRLGAQAGLLFSAGSDHRLSIEGDIYFAMKGSDAAAEGTPSVSGNRFVRQSDPNADTTVSKVRLNYAEIPLLLRLNLAKKAISILGGGSVAVRLACAVTLTSNLEVIPDKDCDVAGEPFIKNTDFSIAGGIGLKFPVLELNLRAVGSADEVTRRGASLDQRFGNVTYSITGRLPFTIPGTGNQKP